MVVCDVQADVVQRATCTGAPVSDEMPFVKMMLAAESLGRRRPLSCNKMTVASPALQEYQLTTLFPSQHIHPARARRGLAGPNARARDRAEF